MDRLRGVSVRLIQMDVKIDLFRSFFPGYEPFTGIFDVEKYNISYIKYNTPYDKHNEL